MRLLRGWRPALRIARREAVRARGRSVLVLVMIGLPVLAIVALDTLARTSDVSTVEGLSRAARLRRRAGRAERRLRPGRPDTGHVVDCLEGGPGAGRAAARRHATVRTLLGDTARVLERAHRPGARCAPTSGWRDQARCRTGPTGPDDRGPVRSARPAGCPVPRTRSRSANGSADRGFPVGLDPDVGRRHPAAGRRHRGVDDHSRHRACSSVDADALGLDSTPPATRRPRSTGWCHGRAASTGPRCGRSTQTGMLALVPVRRRGPAAGVRGDRGGVRRRRPASSARSRCWLSSWRWRCSRSCCWPGRRSPSARDGSSVPWR